MKRKNKLGLLNLGLYFTNFTSNIISIVQLFRQPHTPNTFLCNACVANNYILSAVNIVEGLIKETTGNEPLEKPLSSSCTANL